MGPTIPEGDPARGPDVARGRLERVVRRAAAAGRLVRGLSTYGTEGAARFLFQRVLGSPHRLIGSRDAARLRRLLQGPAAAAIVHVIIEQGRMVSCEVYEDACWSASRGGIDKAAMAPATATQ